MYSTCLFCNRDLGRNDVVEHFPVGRRLAFDSAKGRLWVVCRACERWNLTPLEERWEAIEECERMFERTRLRTSTDHVGLAKLGEGLELVRVGSPLRPEFAAWRYGDQFGRRRVRQAFLVGGGVVAVAGLFVGGAAVGVTVGGFGWVGSQVVNAIVRGNPEKVVARVPTATNGVLHVRRRHLAETSLERGADDGLALRLRAKNASVLLTGAEAARAAGLVLPAVNRFGGSRRDVADAVDAIERSRDPAGYLAGLVRSSAALTRPPERHRRRGWNAEPGGLLALPKVERLALEMAVHEEQERRALDGEMAQLELAWRDAEEIAAIADDLLLPDGVRERLRALRDG